MTKKESDANRDGISKWNHNLNPVGWWELVASLLLSAVWIFVTLVYPFWDKWEWNGKTGGVFVAYGWVGLGGIVVTFFVVEFNRWLFSKSPFLSTNEQPQGRIAPRFRAIVEGVIERLLFTTLFILIVYSQESGFTIIGAIGAGYVVLKGVKRFRATTEKETTNVAIHSIWGVIVSILLAVYGGIVYNQIAAGS